MMVKSTTPNILLIMTDQHRFDAVGFNGNPYVRTPHLDALAARSVNFTNHTCSTPLCTPARASLFTGLYPHSHGAELVGFTLSPAAPTLATWLSAAGYRCGIFGKSHLEPEASGFPVNPRPSEPYYGFHNTTISEDTLAGPYMDWIRREHPQHEAAAWTQANEAMQAEHIGKNYSTRDATRMEEVYPSPLPYELSQSLWITRQAGRFIREEHAAGTPFFAVCSYVPPHHPQTPPEPFASMYRPADLPIPQRLPQDYVSPWKMHAYYHLPNLPDSELQRYMAAYYGLCTMVDDCIGHLLRTLRDCDAERDTVIVFTSDHGDYNGEFGLVRKGGPLFDALLRVPLLVHVPGHAGNGSRRDALTQHEDVAPTILELLGLPIPQHVQGTSFAPALADPSVRPRPYSFFELAMVGEQMVNGISDGAWKLLHYRSVGDVLVNADGDEREFRNRAADAEAGGVQVRLHQALHQWMLRTPPFRWPTKYPW